MFYTKRIIRIIAALTLLLAFGELNSFSQCTANFESTNNPDLEGCEPLSIAFSDLSLDVSSRTWYFGDSIILEAQNPSFTFMAGVTGDTTYTVRLVIECSSGSSSTEETVTVYAKPKVDFSANKSSVCAINDSICFTNLTEHTPDNVYSWDFGDGTISPSRSVCKTYSTPDTYDVILTVTNQHECRSTKTKQNFVRVEPVPSTAFKINSGSGCVPFNLRVENITDIVQGEEYSNWTWDFGDGSDPVLAFEAEPHTYTEPGEYTIKLGATNSLGCFNFSTRKITVNPSPVARFKSTSPDCQNDFSLIEFNGSYSANPQFTWNFDTAQIVNGSGEGPYNVKWNEPGNKLITLTLSEDGCSSTFAAKVQITPIAEVYLDISATDDSICAGQSVKFTATPDNFSSYSFYKNETLLQSSADNSFEGSEFSNGDKVYVSITDINGCTQIISDTILIYIKPTPNISLANNTANDSSCFNDPIVFTASPTTYNNYVFYLNNIEVQNSEDNQFFINDLEQGDRVHVTTTSNECTSPVSNIERITLIDALPPPQVYCGSSDPTRITFAWDSVENAIGYEISIDDGPFINPNSGSTGLYHELTGLSANELHYIKAKTIDDFTCGIEQASDTVHCYSIECNAIEFKLDNPYRYVCEGERVELTVESLNIADFEIDWNYGDKTGTSLTYSFIAEKDTVIPVTIKNSNQPSCPTVTKKYTIYFTPKGSIELSCDDSDNIIIGEKTVSFSVTPEYYDNYTLYDNGKDIISGSLNTFSYDKIKDNHYFYASATDDGCLLISDTLTFVVKSPLSTPEVNFLSSTENSITFQWDPVPGATGYLISQDGEIFIVPSSGTTGLTHVISPLDPGSAVSVSVIALGDGVLGNSDISQAAIGYAETCNSITFNIQDEYEICTGDTIDIEILDLSLDDYMVSWGLLPPSRKKSISLQPMEDTVIFVTVKNPQQPFCAGVTKFVDIKVTENPQKLTLASTNANEACIGSLIKFNSSPGGYDQYEFFNYGQLIEQGSYNAIDIYAEKDKTYNIRARAVNDACYGDLSNVIESRVLDPLPKPQTNCGTTTQNSIEFRWDPVPDAVSYLVQVDGAAYKIPSSGSTGLTHSVTGLSPEEELPINVMAIGPTSCSNSDPSIQITCRAQDCDMVDFVIDPYQTVCENENIDLEINSVSISNYGISWEGGTYGSNTSFAFSGTVDSIISVSLKDNNQAETCPSVDKYFEVNVINTVPATLVSDDADNKICPGASVSLSADPEGFERYVFLNDAVILQDSMASTLTLRNIHNDYNITVQVYQNNCLTTSSSLSTEVITLPDVTMTASASGDVCRNQPVNITASSGFEKYLISNGDYTVKESNSSVTEILLNDTMLTITGITQENCRSNSSDTLYFSILEPPTMQISCSKDTICYGEYTSYYAYPQDLLSYTFYNGSVTLQNSVSDFYATDSLRTGDVISVVGLGKNGCLSEHKETKFPYIIPYPDYTIGSSKEGICVGDSIELSLATNLPGNNFTYQWNTGETTETIVVAPTNSTTYSLSFSDGGRCTDIEIDDELVIVDTQPPPVAEAGDSVTICIYDSTLLEASGGISYQWSPAESLDNPSIFDPFASPVETTTYYVTATNTFCTDIDSVTVIVDLCLEDLEGSPIPQIISPNEDGINDYWEVLNIDYFEENSVKIFNRWGNEVYSASPYNNEWNGVTNQGADLPDGTYFYIINLGNGTKEKTGFIIIHR